MTTPRAAAPWSAPAPSALPELRDRLLEYLRGPYAHATVLAGLQSGGGSASPGTGDLERDAAILIREETHRLAAATLVSVTSPATRAALTHAEQLPVGGLTAADLPTPSGFAVFADPIAHYPTPTETSPAIVAASWGPSELPAIARGSGVWVTLWGYVDPEVTIASLRRSGMDAATAQARALAVLPPLFWDTEVLIGFQAAGIVRATSGGRALNVVRPVTDDLVGRDVTGGTLSPGMVLRAAWSAVLRGESGEVETVELSRAQRRRAQAAGATAAAVQVLHARSAGPDDGGAEGAEEAP